MLRKFLLCLAMVVFSMGAALADTLNWKVINNTILTNSSNTTNSTAYGVLGNPTVGFFVICNTTGTSSVNITLQGSADSSNWTSLGWRNATNDNQTLTTLNLANNTTCLIPLRAHYPIADLRLQVVTNATDANSNNTINAYILSAH